MVAAIAEKRMGKFAAIAYHHTKSALFQGISQMFQSFEVATSPQDGPPRLAKLRATMAEQDVSAFLIPRADAHRGENVAACDERLAWLTGFTGSAGIAVAGRARAVVFVDGRYTLQIRDQVDGNAFEYASIPKQKVEEWLIEALDEGAVAGFDPWLHTRAEVDRYKAALEPKGITLRPVANLVDHVWADRPAAPATEVVPHPLTFTGRSHQDKRAAIGESLTRAGVDAAVLTLLDSIAWLLNIRAGDIARMPVARGFATIDKTGAVHLFVTDPNSVGPETRAHLGADIQVAAITEFAPHLEALGGKIALDKASAPVAVADHLTAAEIIWQRDPCVLMKACKTKAEIDGARMAHLRDGAAMVEFLHWLGTHPAQDTLTEIEIATKLESFRHATNTLRDISFESIAGAGPNGAIVHYRVNTDTNRTLGMDTLFLIDSGGQYLDGTTDITRTVAIGTPPPEASRAFTLVLKGMIGISMLRWPEGLAGRDLDAMARAPLWAAGLDYDHGTGHGVGAYLGVHEGPVALSRRSSEPILAGMILSNEPGYYKEGAFGIRIENLIVVEPATIPEGGERAMLGFETLTFAPIDRNLIDSTLLTQAERDWLDTYHAGVWERLSEQVSPAAKDWLKHATAPLSADHS